MSKRNWLILLVPVLSGLVMAAVVPSLVKAHSRLVFEDARSLMSVEIPHDRMDAPSAAFDIEYLYSVYLPLEFR